MRTNIFHKLSTTVGQAWTQKFLFKMSWGSAVFVSLFLILFQPFGINEMDMPVSKYLVMIGYGLITGGVLHLTGLLINFIGKFHFMTIWNILLGNIFQMACIALANAYYSIAVGFFENTTLTVLSFIYYTYLIGIFPTLFIIMSRYKEVFFTTQQKEENTKPQEENTSSNILNLIGQNQDDQVSLQADDFLFMQSSDNYTSLFYIQNKEIKKAILRGSLTYFQEQIHNKNIQRCHRSYIVNFDKVIAWDGNSSGGKITLSAYEESIPVSRNYAQKWNNTLKNRLSNIPKIG